MARAPRPKPFDGNADWTALGGEWAREVEDALNARSTMIGDGGIIDLVDWFYEQGRSQPDDRPFAGAADLTSWFITENVDAYRARLLQIVFKPEPFCTVDGWGESSKNAPFVEAFHDWQIHEEGLPEELAKIAHGGLLEDAHILEVREKIETRKLVEELDIALELDPVHGGPIFDESGKAKLKKHPDTGELVPAKDGEPAATIKRTSTKTRRLGPEYDVISMKDFVWLPGHARSQKAVWGYAVRVWARLPDLQEGVADGLYDQAAVDLLGTQSDRETVPTAMATPVNSVAPQLGDSVEKELWRLAIKRDLDGDGREEWYTATLSLKHRVLLRCKLDLFVMNLGIPRCVPFVFFPRRNSVYGYSYAADKMLTLAEEHTALRNMKADRGALATNAPLKVLRGAQWDPEAEPLGVGRVIRVDTQQDIEPLQIPDVPNSIVEQERALISGKERVGGLSDMAIGVNPDQARTLGENQLVSAGSTVRVDETLGYFRASIAKVMKLRHAIWIETLKEDSQGLEAPASVIDRLSARGQPLPNGRFTLALLQGKFQFKPYGSVETADPHVVMAYFNQGLQALGGLAKEFPALGVIFQNPDVARAVLEEWARVYKIRDRATFIKALQAQPPGMGAPMPNAAGPSAAAPMGAPPGGPPPAGGPPNLMALLASLHPGGAPGTGGPTVQ